LDVYGCQMNVGDAEVVNSVLKSKNYVRCDKREDADVWFLVTCSIRESAEEKIFKKLKHINLYKRKKLYNPNLKVAVLGCMAERLKGGLLESGKADLVAGPDSYRDLPRLLTALNLGVTDRAMNVMLSLEETYADITPVRLNQNSVTAFVSIQRGCDNMCSYCIVPFTRGKERSRPVESIVEEVRKLVDQGVKEVTLLGQNVNSYRDLSTISTSVCGSDEPAPGFKTVYKPKTGGLRFADLLDRVSRIDPENLRVRFTSPHPKDFPSAVLDLIAERPNICNQLHLPAQCGNDRILEGMRRGYTREAYLKLVDQIRSRIPGVCLSSDFIAGFCDESEEEFRETLTLMEEVKYHSCFLFPYSLREGTHAHRKQEDNVPLDVKKERMLRMVDLYRSIVTKLNKEFEGTVQRVLIEGDSKRSSSDFQGRADGNQKVIFPKLDSSAKVGDYCDVKIHSSNSQSLKGVIV